RLNVQINKLSKQHRVNQRSIENLEIAIGLHKFKSTKRRFFIFLVILSREKGTYLKFIAVYQRCCHDKGENKRCTHSLFHRCVFGTES
ncbi:MAG: hypothetical protein O7D30_04135, partial [Rickettsia endosymbiont of Ixodes persulcatus]|nr:hypothetical protein [Rickettsia endosymbiont of Ixodes persulcatus]